MRSFFAIVLLAIISARVAEAQMTPEIMFQQFAVDDRQTVLIDPLFIDCALQNGNPVLCGKATEVLKVLAPHMPAGNAVRLLVVAPSLVRFQLLSATCDNGTVLPVGMWCVVDEGETFDHKSDPEAFAEWLVGLYSERWQSLSPPKAQLQRITP